MDGFHSAKQWLESRIVGIQDEITEISGFIDENKNKSELSEQVKRYEIMLACRLHTQTELECMLNDLRDNLGFELENIE